LGTSAYMSPEQARSSIEEVDRRSDVFGLGAILCEILTGAPPYTAEGREGRGKGEALLRQAQEADLPAALARIHGCVAEPELSQLGTRCPGTRKDVRPVDATEVGSAAAEYLSAVQERLQQERLERERQQVKAAEKRQRRKLWMALAASVVAAIVLAV